jgi:UDP:flavonoid glycosyltransferase YjiC (YdhE family)
MKALFASVGSPGFLFPQIAIASKLRDLGHEVAFVTDAAWAGILEDEGLRRISRGAKDGRSFQLEHWFYPLSAALQVKHLEYALECFSADVLVGQPLTLGAYLVSERSGLPLAVVGLLTPLYPTGVAEGSPVDGVRQGRHEQTLGFYNEARKLFGMPTIEADPLSSPLLGDLLLGQSIPELWPIHPDLEGRMKLVGSCLWEPPAGPEVEAWLTRAREAGGPVVYVEFGRNFKRAQPLATVLEGLAQVPDLHLAASVARCDGEVGEVPERFLLRGLVPQGRVLAEARLVVSGGNSTITLGALTHGLPSLILYGGGEQGDTALLCEREGAALTLPVESADAKDVLRGYQILSGDGPARTEAERLRRSFESLDGPAAAARHILELAGADEGARASYGS